MKSFISIIFCLLALGACIGGSQSQSQEAFIASYIEKYPKATLRDIYKIHFQDKFGPAHLLLDREAVKGYIVRELESAETFEQEYYQPCSWRANFYQVNLSVIRDGKVSLEEFTDAFIASANGIDTTLTKSWIEEWQHLVQIVREQTPQFDGFKEDSAFLAELLSKGQYVVHHSRIFNHSYHPHYRIIRRDIFEERILPKLK